MSIRHDSPAWWRDFSNERGPVAQGRAVPLREGPSAMWDAFNNAPDPATCPCSRFQVLTECLCRKGSAPSTAQPPQAAVAPPAAPETGVADPIVAKVCALLLSRSAVGIAKYGTTLAANPLTRKQWAQHALEEALDLACYLQRMIEMEDGE